MTVEEFTIICHNIKNKRSVSSLIMKTKYRSLKYIYTKTVNKENKRNAKTNVLSFCLGSLGVNNLLGLRNGSIWSLAFTLILVFVLALGSLNFFPLASTLARICWDFHKSKKGLICCKSFRHLDWLLWERRAKTWELLDVGIIVYALRSS